MFLTGLIRFFLIFKRKKKEFKDMRPAAMLKSIQLHVPDFYRTSEFFKESQLCLEHNVWGLALENLIDMADESGHYFSNTFWDNLTACATSMGMLDRADYCRQQIERNNKEVEGKVPYGWTAIKIDDNHYQHHIAAILRDEWTNNRRNRDGFDKLIKQNGFHLKNYGRVGTIYYVDNGRVMEIEFEMSAVPQYNILVYFDEIKTWAAPKGEPLNAPEKQQIKDQLSAWLTHKGIKSDLG